MLSSGSARPGARVLLLRAILLAAGAIVFAVLIFQVRRAVAHHDVHYNNWYWREWAYTPLVSVPVNDCGITQDVSAQGASDEWNATGYVVTSTTLNSSICNTDPVGIRWFSTTGSGGFVQSGYIQPQPNYLDPDPPYSPVTNYAVKINIFIGSRLGDGDGACGTAGGGQAWYSPCDTLTHEFGHALGLADHYYNASSGAGPSYYVFSYPTTPGTVNSPPTQVPSVGVTPTIMDYPHRTDIQQHDRDDVNTLYRRAPFSPWNMSASWVNFHRINTSWTDRSHNETTFYVDQSFAGGAYVNVASPGTDVTSAAVDITKPGDSYCYRAYGRNSWALAGANSNTSCTTPPNAVGTGAIGGSFPAGSTSVALCWNPAPANAGVTGYFVVRRRKTISTGSITSTYYLESTTTDCYGTAVLWTGTVTNSTNYTYHWAVKGCDGSFCSDYKDMTSPSYQWVKLPWTGSGNSGSPTSGYHPH